MATPAPTTPQLNTSTKIRSNITLRMLANIKKIKGVLLSPNALKIPDTPLYNPIHIIPIDVTLRYATASSKITASVCKSIRIGLAAKYPAIAIMAEHAIIIMVAFPMVSLTFFSSLAPKYWETMIPIPTERPPTSEKKKNCNDAVVPMAPRAFALTNRPTITESTILYSC